MRNRYLYITLLSVLALHIEAQNQNGTKQVPRLVVNISIDQLDSDHLEWFAPVFGDEGFKKLISEGLVFEKAFFPFSPDRASAISSIVTGSSPFYHQITGEQWIDRKTLRRLHCTDDPLHPGIPAPIQIAVSTIGDELKIATEGKGKVFAIAPTSDAAVLSAGHAADGAFWIGQKQRWTGSQYYANYAPLWLLKQADVVQQAEACIVNEALGQDSIPDLLCLTFDASKQDKDAYIQIDKAIGKLRKKIEETIGSGKTLYVMTSTGYHSPVPVDYERYRIPTGIFYINRTANLLNMYFGAIWGVGRYVETCFKNQIYLNHNLLETKQIRLVDVLQRAQEFICQMAGVKRVSINTFGPNHSDLQIEVAPGWQIQNEDTHENWLQQLGYHSFPIIIAGPGITAERTKTPVSIERIAPSIAKAIRIRAPNACMSEPLF